MPEATDEVIHVADSVNEFVERTRLQEIHEAKQEATSAVRNSEFQEVEFSRRFGNEDGQRMAARNVRKAVETYILEVEAIYQRTEAGRELWANAPLGELSLDELAPGLDLDGEDVLTVADVEIRSRGDLSYDVTREDDPFSRGRGAVTDATVSVAGVGTFVDGLAGRVTATVTEESGTGWANGVEETTRTAELVAPIWLSREALRATNALLTESDVGVQLVSDDDTRGIENDYTELLDELTDD
jgi:hypothetical protein